MNAAINIMTVDTHLKSYKRLKTFQKRRNVRLGAEYAGLEFWLSSISCHAPNAPILISE